jgi:hypothetical protein
LGNGRFYGEMTARTRGKQGAASPMEGPRT